MWPKCMSHAHRAWLSLRAMLRGLGADARTALEGNLLSALLLALQRVPPLLAPTSGAAARSETRAALRAALTQVPASSKSVALMGLICISLGAHCCCMTEAASCGSACEHGAASLWRMHADKKWACMHALPTQALGVLLELCAPAEPACATALAAVCAITQRHLTPSDWLPLLDQAGVQSLHSLTYLPAPCASSILRL